MTLADGTSRAESVRERADRVAKEARTPSALERKYGHLGLRELVVVATQAIDSHTGCRATDTFNVFAMRKGEDAARTAFNAAGIPGWALLVYPMVTTNEDLVPAGAAA